MAVVIVVLLLRDSRFCLEAEELSFCGCCWSSCGSLMWKEDTELLIISMGMCRRQVQGWDSALCSVVQEGKRWLRSGQNEEVRTWWQTVIPPVAVGPRIYWLNLSKILPFFSTKTTELYHTALLLLFSYFVFMTWLVLAKSLHCSQCVIKSLCILQTEDIWVSELM